MLARMRKNTTRAITLPKQPVDNYKQYLFLRHVNENDYQNQNSAQSSRLNNEQIARTLICVLH
jgi:hypothetical protein